MRDEVEALCERLRTAKDDDHERGCQMRFALCSCGFDDARARTAGEAAAMLSALADENAELRAAKWAVQHVDTMNDLVAMGLARDAAEARAIAAEEALVTIANGNVSRPIGKPWRGDGKPSKNDKCVHDVWMYEDCATCIEDFARAAAAISRGEHLKQEKPDER